MASSKQTTNTLSNGIIPTVPNISSLSVSNNHNDITTNTDIFTGISRGRLASFKLPRDLTLGGTIKIPKDLAGSKNKRMYAPNLNVTRNKTKQKHEGLTTRAKKFCKDAKNNKPRTKPTSNLIQTKGIFSEGTAETFNKRSNSNFIKSNTVKDEPPSSIPMPTLNKYCVPKVNKMKEKLLIDELVKDDFDPSTDLENEVAPINLPFIPKLKKGIRKESMVKLDTSAMDTNKNSIESVLDEQKKKFFIFQLPDSLPGCGPDVEEVPVDGKESKLYPISRCTVNDLSDGLLGKMLIHKSGRTEFVINDTRYNIEAGVQPIYEQCVVSVSTASEDEKHNMINLGPLVGGLVAYPQWDHLLSSTATTRSPFLSQYHGINSQ